MKRLFSLMLVLCLMCGVIPAVAEGGVTVSAGSMVFELPEGATIKSQKSAGKNAYTFTAKCTEDGLSISYEVMGLVYQYDEADQGEQGVMDYQTFYLLTALLFGQENMNVMSPSDAGAEMPDGQVLLSGAMSSGNKFVYAVSHYNEGVGYMLALTATYSPMALAVLMGNAEDIALSAKSVSDLVDGEALGTIVITNSSANIRSGADGSAAKIKSAVKGDTFPWLGEENGWYKILVDGQIGYVSKSLSKVQ